MKIRLGSVRGFACVCAAAGASAGAIQAQADPAADSAPERGRQSSQADPGKVKGDAPAMPKIAVSNREPVAGGADARVHIGGVTISRARFVVPSANTHASATEVASGNEAIWVPLNTVGPGGGETLQQRNERIAAENRRLVAEAAIAEREAARPAPRDDERDTVIVFGPRGRQVYRFGGRGIARSGATFTTGTVTRLGGLHDQAQSHFAAAASAGTGLYGTLPQDAQRHIHAASQPNLSEQQRARDEVQRNLQTPPKLPGAAE